VSVSESICRQVSGGLAGYHSRLHCVALKSSNLQICSKDSFGEVESGWIEVRALLFSIVGLGASGASRLEALGLGATGMEAFCLQK